MSNSELENAIEAAWNVREEITPSTTGETRKAIEATLSALDAGSLRVAEKNDKGDWIVNQWAKKAVLLGFRLKDMEVTRVARRTQVGGTKLIISSKDGTLKIGKKQVLELYQVVL